MTLRSPGAGAVLGAGGGLARVPRHGRQPDRPEMSSRASVPKILSSYATWEYSWIRPPSRSRRRSSPQGFRYHVMRQVGDPWRRPVRVGVIGVLAEDQPHLTFAGDQHPVQALAAGVGDPPLGNRVGRRRRLHPIQMIGTDVSRRLTGSIRCPAAISSSLSTGATGVRTGSTAGMRTGSCSRFRRPGPMLRRRTRSWSSRPAGASSLRPAFWLSRIWSTGCGHVRAARTLS